ncbi:E3 ubiquitin/ISG15 ligase TRIM25 [Anabarilius grahami]|uniref:E3 ubiquitin/ISG15 ligase TRIM25 n=1 Tax=Anabarilius grahami TaxID=495550 RepID=A0A3N0YUN6_ANAGA|nr:E3 ubiquitin/ISG15 ligase TRIM25 [Anabarilius grahami]
MSESAVSQYVDQFSCSVCLDPLKEPVTIPCGHSYCMSCITDCWGQKEQGPPYRCPQCRESFSQRPLLKKNTLIAEMMETLQKTSLQTAAVECDVCTTEKNRAVKSCLQCLASFCQTHLQLHYESPAFMKHKLVEASRNIQENICLSHGKLLEIYCQDDHQCICNLCMIDNHKKHNVVSVDSEWTSKKKELKEIKVSCQKLIQERERGQRELREAVKTFKTVCKEMAESAVSQYEDQFSCPVCLDPLKEPVTIPCGHSYCMSCITDCWGQKEQGPPYRCPQCRESFSQRPLLKKNTLIAEMMETLQKTSLQTAAVECDVCTTEKNRAVKSCLQCLASFCQTHLQLHYESPAFMKHKLVEASRNIQENICLSHGKLLEIYCQDDHQCICNLCMIDNHKKHNVVSVDSEWTSKKSSALETMEDIEKVFTELICSLEKKRSEIKEQIRAQEKTEIDRAEELHKHLDQELTELRRRQAEIEKLLITEDQVQCLKSFQSVCVLPSFEDVPSFTQHTHLSFKDISISAFKEVLEDACQQYTARISREDFCELHLDLNTANKKLKLTEENRKISASDEAQQYPDHPERFDVFRYILCQEGLCDRCYWEVEGSGKNWAVVVCYKGIERKGNSEDCALGFNKKSWRLGYCLQNFSFIHDKTKLRIPAASRIGVYLDHRAGTLSFYSVSDTMTILHRVQTKELKKVKVACQKLIQERERGQRELREAVKTLKSSALETMEDIEKVFTELICSLEKKRSEIKEQIRAQEKTEIDQAEELHKHLDQELTELRKRQAEIEKLLITEDQIQFLKISVNCNWIQTQHTKTSSCQKGTEKHHIQLKFSNIVITQSDLMDIAMSCVKRVCTVAVTGRSSAVETIGYPSEMSESAVSQYVDQFSCSVCLDPLKEPVTIPCGHSYCMSCITDCWGQKEQGPPYRCPQCRESFSQRPLLKKNTLIAEMMETLQKTSLQTAAVECDVCTTEKNRAVKSCLQCLASFCQTHLQLHYESPAFMKHKLVKASRNIQENICLSHGKLLEIYCQDDHQCICYLCMIDSHKNHNTVSVDSEWTSKKKELKEMKVAYQKLIQERERGQRELSEAVKSFKSSALETMEDIEKVFTELICSLEKKRSEIKEQIRAQEKTEIDRAEELHKHLDQELTELRQRQTEIEKLLNTDDQIQCLKSCQSVCVFPSFEDVPSFTQHTHLSFKDISISAFKEVLEDVCQQQTARISREEVAYSKHRDTEIEHRIMGDVVFTSQPVEKKPTGLRQKSY